MRSLAIVFLSIVVGCIVLGKITYQWAEDTHLVAAIDDNGADSFAALSPDDIARLFHVCAFAWAMIAAPALILARLERTARRTH
jgi:hypothetical protein